jgi:hypothetical protein
VPVVMVLRHREEPYVDTSEQGRHGPHEGSEGHRAAEDGGR